MFISSVDQALTRLSLRANDVTAVGEHGRRQLSRKPKRGVGGM